TGVHFVGANVSRKELLRKVTDVGERFSAFDLQQDVEEIRSYFVSRDFLDVEILPEVKTQNGKVEVTYRIEPGSHIRLSDEGARGTKRVREDIHEIWITGLFEEQIVERVKELLLRHFRNEGYLEVEVTSEAARGPDHVKDFIFRIMPGPDYGRTQWVFRGAPLVEVDGKPGDVIADLPKYRNLIERHYAAKGYLDVFVQGPELQLSPGDSKFVVTVDLGPQYVVRAIKFSGNTFFPDGYLAALILADDAHPVITDELIARASETLTRTYLRQGFNQVEIKPSIERYPGEPSADLR